MDDAAAAVSRHVKIESIALTKAVSADQNEAIKVCPRTLQKDLSEPFGVIRFEPKGCSKDARLVPPPRMV